MISIDTELSWGTFDVGRVDSYLPAYNRTRSVVNRLINLFDEYEVSATWATVAHLLHDCGGEHRADPGPDYWWIDNWYGSLPCVTGRDRSLWYAPEMIDAIRQCQTPQEIGVHAYSHLILGERGCSSRVAKREIDEAIRIMESHGIEPESFVFPRNSIGHQEILSENGVRIYRGRDARWYERRALPDVIRKVPRYIEEATKITPPSVIPTWDGDIIKLPGSQVFRPFHDGWQFTPSSSRVVKAKKGLDRAVSEGEIFHLRFHPFDFGFNPDDLLSKLAKVLHYANEMRDKGLLDVLCMREVADEFIKGRWE